MLPPARSGSTNLGIPYTKAAPNNAVPLVKPCMLEVYARVDYLSSVTRTTSTANIAYGLTCCGTDSRRRWTSPAKLSRPRDIGHRAKFSLSVKQVLTLPLQAANELRDCLTATAPEPRKREAFSIILNHASVEEEQWMAAPPL